MKLALLCLLASGCASGLAPAGSAVRQELDIDRFSARAGHLQVRTAANHLPGPGAAVDFDRAPFITQSRGPAGELIRYYNFDVQSTTPAIVYELVDGSGAPVVGQDPIIDAIPGEAGYSDFVRRVLVTAPTGYVPNQLRSAAALATLPVRDTGELYNRPVVPPGSVARERLNGASPALASGWYRGQRVSWLTFTETQLVADRGRVPTAPIYVAFNVNPGSPGGGPPSGFRTEKDRVQTHNVASSLPGDLEYSPLWDVSVYDTAAFPSVHDMPSLQRARLVAPHVANVNCPVVFVAP